MDQILDGKEIKDSVLGSTVKIEPVGLINGLTN